MATFKHTRTSKVALKRRRVWRRMRARRRAGVARRGAKTLSNRGAMEKRILLGVVLGVVTYALIGLASDASQVIDALATLPWWVPLGALGLTVVNYMVRFAKWHYYLRCLGLEVGVGLSANVFLAGLSMSVTPGKVGEVLKSVLLRDAEGNDVARTAPIVLAERLTDLLGLFLIASLGVATFDYGRWAFAAAVALVLALLVVLHQPRLVEWLLMQWARLPIVGGLHVKLSEAYGVMRQLVGWRVLGVTTLMSLASWSMEGIAFFWMIEALGGGMIGASADKAEGVAAFAEKRKPEFPGS